MTMSSGTAKSIHLKKGMRTLVNFSMSEMPMRLGGVPDGRPDAARGGGVGGHQHHGRAEAEPLGIDRPARPAGRDLGHGPDDAQPDGEHHGARGRVADPHGDEGADRAEGEKDAAGPVAHPAQGHDAVGEALVQPVMGHGLGQDEAAQEEEDHRDRRRRRRRSCAGATPRRTASVGPHHGGHGQGDGLGDPPDHDPDDDRGQGVGGTAERRQGQKGHDGRGQRPEDEADRVAQPLEPLFPGRRGLLRPSSVVPHARSF